MSSKVTLPVTLAPAARYLEVAATILRANSEAAFFAATRVGYQTMRAELSRGPAAWQQWEAAFAATAHQPALRHALSLCTWPAVDKLAAPHQQVVWTLAWPLLLEWTTPVLSDTPKLDPGSLVDTLTRASIATFPDTHWTLSPGLWSPEALLAAGPLAVVSALTRAAGPLVPPGLTPPLAWPCWRQQLVLVLGTARAPRERAHLYQDSAYWDSQRDVIQTTLRAGLRAAGWPVQAVTAFVPGSCVGVQLSLAPAWQQQLTAAATAAQQQGLATAVLRFPTRGRVELWGRYRRGGERLLLPPWVSSEPLRMADRAVRQALAVAGLPVTATQAPVYGTGAALH